MKFNELISGLTDADFILRSETVKAINLALVVRNWLFGWYIVEFEQNGEDRAKYGDGLINQIAEQLKKNGVSGCALSNLKNIRMFYNRFSYKCDSIPFFTNQNDENKKSQTVSGLFGKPSLKTKQLTKSVSDSHSEKSQTASGEFGNVLQNAQKTAFRALVSELSSRFMLSWSHYLLLSQLDNSEERQFYEIEASNENWSLRELKRQIAASLYERLVLNRDKDEVKRLSQEGLVIAKPRDIVRDPYVLEFLELEQPATYSESQLETAIIDKLSKFLLELGKGYLFEARQRRFTFEERHFYVDLVTYNRFLRCYVLFDLKTDDLTHQDLGQMQMYVNYFDREVKMEEENPTIGILLCKRKNDAIVEMTLPANSNIFASKYQLYLPDKAELQRQINEAAAMVNEEGDTK